MLWSDILLGTWQFCFVAGSCLASVGGFISADNSLLSSIALFLTNGGPWDSFPAVLVEFLSSRRHLDYVQIWCSWALDGLLSLGFHRSATRTWTNGLNFCGLVFSHDSSTWESICRCSKQFLLVAENGFHFTCYSFALVPVFSGPIGMSWVRSSFATSSWEALAKAMIAPSPTSGAGLTPKLSLFHW